MSNEFHGPGGSGIIDYRLRDRAVLALDGWLRGRRSFGGFGGFGGKSRGAAGEGAAADPAAGDGPKAADRARGGTPGAAAPSGGYPADGVAEDPLDHPARRVSGGLMRVNHAGEVAAQALYLGQSVFARDPAVRRALAAAAGEERDHLDWCRRRLGELGAGPSRLDPLWSAGSFVIGAAAGAAGDAVSLGFVAETERQVVEHLARHLERLPAGDRRSRAICRRMMEDERRHGTHAARVGGRPLPAPARLMMRAAARVMTTAAYRL